MQFRRLVEEYFTFTRRERIAVLALLVVALLVFLLPGMISTKQRFETKLDTSWFSSVIPVENENGAGRSKPRYDYPLRANADNQTSPAQLFPFDPNTATEDEWRRLGLREKTIGTIQKYLERGGQFRRPEDLRKIYGLRKDEWTRLIPLVRITPLQSIPVNKRSVAKPGAPVRIPELEINSADTSDFEALPGIGPTLAARIWKFREKLGGFYSIEQISETFGLPDSTFSLIRQHLKLSGGVFRKLPLNSASVEQLQAHPYIGWKLARPIVAFREQHGPFMKPEDLKKVHAITDQVYMKLHPYLSLD
ncbi:MAG TPA: helix-hairpin-helix domain-containing protein [Chitinophagaceae bacterium]|nr:helix-hairpin-helix domain-containing protein [Chitinophagaceae bacterium]